MSVEPSATSSLDPASKPTNVFLTNVMNFTYKPRRFMHKGAFVTQLWNFGALSLFIFFLTSNHVDSIDYKYGVGFGLSAVMFPVAGWLADVYIGRYRVLKYSMITMWMSAILYVTAVIVRTQFPLKKAIVDPYVLPTVILGMMGFSAFQANTLQFGLDQLVDASSSDISSYISWYGWIFFAAFSVVQFSQSCTCGHYAALSSLLLPVILTVCVSSDFLFNNWLVKEPAGFNPLKLIFKVLRYAAKNKYPRQRSAFTYWEDKPYSRIDLAKSKYGGPFTTEQVEDVKTFFRLLVIVILGSLFAGLVFVVNSTVSHEMMLHYRDPHYTGTSFNNSVLNCYQRVLVDGSSHLVMVVFIPLFELIFYPIVWKCFQKLTIINKFTLGVVFQLCYHVSLMILEVVGHYMTSHDSSLPQNYSVPCMLKLSPDRSTENATLIVNYKWIAIPRIINGVSVYCLLMSTVEFFSAQSPYSMKGLVAGLTYCMCGIAVLLCLGMKVPFHHLFNGDDLGKRIKFGCGVWYFFSVSLLSVIWIVIAAVANKVYSRRRRDENIHNEHIFAVNYYS